MDNNPKEKFVITRTCSNMIYIIVNDRGLQFREKFNPEVGYLLFRILHVDRKANAYY